MSAAPPPTELPAAAIEGARQHVDSILRSAIEHSGDQRALVVSDSESPLARGLTEAYRRTLPDAEYLDFTRTDPAEVRARFEALSPGDLVVLIQSTSFRLDAFRIRLELFQRGLKVIEHPHLARMSGDEALVYLDALAYDPDYYRGVGRALKARIDTSAAGAVLSGGARLDYPAGFEPAKLNVGDYSRLPNVGGQFPIGEVFTESRDLEAVEGSVRIGFFGDTDFRVNRPPAPITLVVEAGRIVAARDSTPEFDHVLAEIRRDEDEVWLRELGFGLNRALTSERMLSDIGTFERMCGVHLSLGKKHATYNKPNIRKKTARYHVDVFVDLETVLLDEAPVYRDGGWSVAGD